MADYNNQEPGKKNCCFTLAVLFFGLFIVLTVLLVYLVLLSKKNIKNETADKTSNLIADFVLPDPYLGSAESKIIIEEYGDMQCPACKEGDPVLKQIALKYQNDVKFVFKDFPLVELHADSLKAALAGQCAHEQEKFWQLEEIIFENQDKLKVPDLKRYAVQAGLDSIKFGACLDSNKYIKSVESDYEEGLARKINSTPSVFINGQIYNGEITLEALSEIIDSLKKQISP